MEFTPNPGQEKVLNHKQGPLLVVAGAGTGKTRTITEKIGKLLDQGVAPTAILAVTFTEKATGEMQDRILRSRTGLLLDLPILTFNGYGDSILHEFGVHIGLSSNYRLLSEEAQIVFFRERLVQFELDYFLPSVGMPDQAISDILRYLGKLKQHLVTPDTYQTFANQLASGDAADKENKRMHQELVRIYTKYTELCRAENFIDYDDQIFLAIQLLEQRPNIRKVLQERYHTIFIDEFQDTNPMQSHLIDLVVNNQQNLIVVGDDDQAIYGWRGATLSNILSFKERYPKADSAALTINYRSHQSILDAAHNLIQHNNPYRLEESLAIDKRLTSTQPGHTPTLHHFDTVQSELAWIANDVAERLSKLKEGEEPSIAILTRSNTSNQLVHRALEAIGVPHRVVGASPDLYEQPVVRTLTELLRTLVEPDNNNSLHLTLTGELFGISNQLIAPLASKAGKTHDLLQVALSDISETKNALELITSLREDAATVPVDKLLWRAIVASGYKDRLLKAALTNEQSESYASNLSQYFETLREFTRIAIQPTATQYMLSLPALRAGGEKVDDTLGITESEVVVSTIHKSKGLEWDTVYVPLLMTQTFPYLGGSGGFEIPEELRASTTSPADERLAEERRLMYVAATRARKNLMLSFAEYTRAGATRARKPSIFIDELLGEGAAAAMPIHQTSAAAVSLVEPSTQEHKVAIPTSILNGHTVRLSASQVDTLLECPLDFWYRYVIGLPSDSTTRTSYGNLMHDLFRTINEAKLNGAVPSIDSLHQQLDADWNREGYATIEQEKRNLAQAHATLARFYEQALASQPPLLVEKEFQVRLAEEDIVLHGRMDVVLDEDGVEIRDYKTGRKDYDEKKLKAKASASTQLAVYALAWQINHDELPARVALHYVDDDMVGAVTKQPKSIETLRIKLAQAAEEVRAGKFEPRGQHKYCQHPPLAEL